MEETASRYGG